jgi:hypothetical protein
VSALGVALLVLIAAGCGSSGGDQATQEAKVQQTKDQIGQIRRYVAQHRTTSATSVAQHRTTSRWETNIIGSQVPSQMLKACRSNSGGVPRQDCKIVIAIANGDLPPGQYSDAELQQRVQAEAVGGG